ncbi:hypothetical protein Tco_0205677 [Tanacetum coccineum]
MIRQLTRLKIQPWPRQLILEDGVSNGKSLLFVSQCSVGACTFQVQQKLLKHLKDDKGQRIQEAIQATFMLGLEKIKGHMKISAKESSYESDEEESESSNSDYDFEIERAIA